MAELTETDFYNALGVQPKDDTQQPAETEPQEPAAPDMDAQAEEDQTQEAPGQNDDSQEDEGQGAAAPDQDPAADQGSLTQEQRRANAARRREAEKKQEIEAAVAKARQEEQQKAEESMKSFFESAGMTNSLTGKPITSKQEFEDFQAAFQADRLKKAAEAGNLTQEMIDQLIESSPKVRQANALLQQQEQQKAEQEAFEAQVAQEMAAIHEIDPSVSSLEDIKASPLKKGFEKNLKDGKSFLASFVAARDELQQQAGQNQALSQQRNAAGKAHLKTPGSTGGVGSQTVPEDLKRVFRQYNPHATDAQISAYYNKHRK